MASLFHFVPREELTAQQNMEDFIRQCRLHYAGSDEEWQSAMWPKARFDKVGAPKGNRGKVLPAWELDNSFMDFAKSYFWYQKAHHPQKNLSYIPMALRVLERSLLQVNQSAFPWLCNVSVLDEAMVILTDNYAGSSAYSCARAMATLADFLAQRGLVRNNIKGWKPNLKTPDGLHLGLGAKAEQYRADQLPGHAEMDAIMEIFSNDPQLPRDVFTSSCFAMLMCAPSRGSEILSLPVNAEINPAEAGRDRQGTEHYGWRFFSAKGGEGDVKWIPKAMEDVAKLAFERMKNLSQPAREFASWVENYPGLFYRHELCPDVPEDQPLTVIQAVQAFGLVKTDSADAVHFLWARGLSCKNYDHTLGSLWKYVLTRLPKDFPWFDQQKGIKWSGALCCILKNQIHAERGTFQVELQRVNLSSLIADLGPPSGHGKYSSIFDRHGYKRADGACMKMTTHQARHLLDTLAAKGGLPEEEIAKWSGRVSVRQNRVYNHMRDEQTVLAIRESLLAVSPPQSVTLSPKDRTPITSEEFASRRTPAVHVTEYGYCTHDYVVSPCVRYRDCINCTEHICVKGDANRLSRIRLRLQRLEEVLALALDDVPQADVMADRWINHHKMTIDHLKRLIQLLTDPDVSDGAVLRINGQDFSHIGRAIGGLKPAISGEERDGEALITQRN